MQTNTRILVVEHHPDNGRFLSQYLRNAGYDAIWTQRADTVVDDCLHFKPNVLIIEMRVSGNFGMRVLEELRKQSQFKDIQIICMSVETTQAEIDLAKSLGANTFLIKPFDYDVIGKRLNALIAPELITSRPLAAAAAMARQ